jgi:hypothetical protein
MAGHTDAGSGNAFTGAAARVARLRDLPPTTQHTYRLTAPAHHRITRSIAVEGDRFAASARLQ